MKKVTIILLISLNGLLNYVVAQNWVSVSDGVPYAVYTIYGDEEGGLLYTGGGYSTQGCLAVYDGTNWNNLNWDSNDWPIYSITKYKDEIYVCGGFEYASGTYCHLIAKWTGVQWDSVTTQIDGGNIFLGGTRGLFATDSFLYLSGTFDYVGNVYSPGIIKYDGTKWIAIGNFEGTFPGGANVNGFNCAAIYNNELYVGGDYEDSTGYTERIAKFDGVNWSNVGQGINGGFAGVVDLQVYKNELYAAGTFTKAEGDPGDFIAKWNGSQWSEVGLGMAGLSPTYNNGQVHDLYVYNNELYACGVFHYAGGVPALYVAKWNGSQWCGFGDTLDNVSIALGSFNGELFMGGGFKVIASDAIEAGDSINHIAKWIGGNFTDTCSITVGTNQIAQYDSSFSVYPNPARDQLHLSFVFPEGKKAVVIINNIVGEQLLIKSVESSNKVIDISKLPHGIYYIILKSEKESLVQKFMKQ